MTFYDLMLSLYESGDITIDEFGVMNFNITALFALVENLAPQSLFNIDLEQEDAVIAIRKAHEEKEYQRNNDARIEDAVDCDSIKSALFSDFQVHYGVSR